MALAIFSEERRKWWTLAAVSFGLFMIMLDNTVVNVALPAIQEDLGAPLGAAVDRHRLRAQLRGADADRRQARRRVRPPPDLRRRHRRLHRASLWCGLADSGEMLIAARVVQGAGAALMNPATLSIIAATFPPRQRGTAIGIWAGVSALALAIGPLVGGLLTEHLSWHWIFFINVPVGVLAIAASFLLIDGVEGRDAREPRPARPRDVGARPLRAHVRPDRGERLRLDLGADRRLVRRRRRLAGLVRRDRAAQRFADARPDALPQRHLRRREHRDAARRAGDVRRLLRLALHAERPRLLGRPGRRRLPADDPDHHPRRPDRREDVRPAARAG